MNDDDFDVEQALRVEVERWRSIAYAEHTRVCACDDVVRHMDALHNLGLFTS